jgi:hypothetical protein
VVNNKRLTDQQATALGAAIRNLPGDALRAQFAVQAWENICNASAKPKGLGASRWFSLCCDKRTAG